MANFNHWAKSRREYFPVIFTNQGNFDLIRELISAQHKKNDKMKTLVVEATEQARKNKFTTIVDFLQAHQDVNQKDDKGNTLLHKAAEKADCARIKELVAKGADVHCTNAQGETPLDSLVKNCRISWETGAEFVENSDSVDSLLANNAIVELQTISRAIESGSVEVLKRLLLKLSPEKKVDVKTIKYVSFKSIDCTEPWYIEPMFAAIRARKSTELLNLLREHGADFNRLNSNGYSLLILAIDQLESFPHNFRSRREAHFSVKSGEDFEPVLDEQLESFQKEVSLVHYLLDNGADPNLKMEPDGVSPLYLLINDKDLSHFTNYGYETLLDKLLEKGTDVNAVNKNHSTALHAAANTGDLPAIVYLVKHQARLNKSDNEGYTPLHLAVKACHPRSTQLLIDASPAEILTSDLIESLLELLEKSYINQKVELLHFNSNTSKLDKSYQKIENALKAKMAPQNKHLDEPKALEPAVKKVEAIDSSFISDETFSIYQFGMQSVMHFFYNRINNEVPKSSQFPYGLTGLHVDYVPGECFFTAVKTNGSLRLCESELREKVVNEIKLHQHTDKYANFFSFQHDMQGKPILAFKVTSGKGSSSFARNWDNYLRLLAKKDTWVDNVEIAALANALEIPIIVIQEGSACALDDCCFGKEYQDKHAPIFIGRINDNHYIPLIFPEGKTAQHIMGLITSEYESRKTMQYQ